MNEERRRRILVVDNDADMLDLIETLLSAKGYEVVTALDGPTAFSLIGGGETIDLFLVDIRMPGMSGIEFFAKLKTMMVKPKLIFISAFNDLAMGDAYSQGALGFIAKPFSNDEIIFNVEESLKDSAGWTRKHTRYDIVLDVKFALQDTHEQPIASHTINIGHGGMFIASGRIYPIGSLISFEINFTEGELKMLSGVGKVAWIRAHSEGPLLSGMGIMFLSLPSEQQQFITKFVKDKCINAFIPLGTKLESKSSSS